MVLSKKSYSKNGIIALCALVYFVSYFSRKDFAAVMVGMINSNIIDKPAGGLIGTGMFICYGVGQLISGYLGDRVKPKHLICFGLGTTAVCNLLMPLVPLSGLMIPVWAVNGFAQAML
jgi:sugar phosphate permease